MPKRTYIRSGGTWVDITSGAAFPASSAAPSSPVAGQVYFDTDDQKPYIWNGTAWVAFLPLSSATPASIAATPVVGTSTVPSREDHVHEGVPATRTLTGTAPITVGGVSGTGQALSANLTVAATAATTSAAGVVQLTDSAQSTSITTAATPNAVLQSTKDRQFWQYNSTTIMGNFPNWLITTATAPTSGSVVHTRHIAERNFTVSNISITVAATASAGLTLARFGIYTRSGTTFTLVARTASDTTIGNTINTRYTRALATTGGYPATYDFLAGNEYWVSFIFIGTTMPTVTQAPTGQTVSPTVFGALHYDQSGQTDLPTTSTLTTARVTRYYSEVS